MKKTTPLFLWAAAFAVINPTEPLKASMETTFAAAGTSEDEATHTRPPLCIRNGSDEILLVELSPVGEPEGTQPYRWFIHPKPEDKETPTVELTHYPFAPGQSNMLTEADRYGTLKVFISKAVEESHSTTQQALPIFEAFVDTSGTFSYYSDFGPHYHVNPLDESVNAKIVPEWLYDFVEKELVGRSPLDRAMANLRTQWASMTPEQKENPSLVDFPSCLHVLDLTLLPLPSSHALRPSPHVLRFVQVEHLRARLDSKGLNPTQPTDSELLKAEEELSAEGIKIVLHGPSQNGPS